MTTASTLPERRLLEELAAINERYPAMKLQALATPTLEGAIEIDGDTHHVQLTLPPSYPRVPPILREIDGSTGEELPSQGRAYRLVKHGVCLFPHGSDPQAWRQDRLAVEALDRFESFIRDERQRTDLHLAITRLHIPATLADSLLELGPGRLTVCRAEAGGDLFTARVEFDRDPSLNYAALDSNWVELLPTQIEIPWWVLTSDKSWQELAGSQELLDETLRDQLPEAAYLRQRSEPWLILVRKGQPEAADGVEVACLFRPPDHVGMLLELEVLRSTPAERLFDRLDGAVNNRDVLAAETVTIVGLGSLGSTVALSLARAGVKHFVLIDQDTLSIENVCRHVGTLRDLGRPKVEIVRDAIESVNPDAEVIAIPKWLAWDLPWMSAGAEFDALCASDQPLTVICTCVEETIERQLNTLAVQRGVSVLYASVLGAAEHGRIFRVLPGRTPCLECILAAQDSDASTYPRFISTGVSSENPPAYLEPGLPGLAIDITQVAMIAARFTLQTIAETRGVDLGLPSETGHHLLWSNRGGWLFDRPLQLIVRRFPRSPSCPVCSPSNSAEDLEGPEQEQLAALIAKLQPEVR